MYISRDKHVIIIYISTFKEVFMNTSILDAQLKYFFLIDTEQITEQICKEFPTIGSSETFSYIFDRIMSSTKLYSRYLSTDLKTYKNFFSNVGSSNNFSKKVPMLKLLQNTLLNNLVLHSYFELFTQNRANVSISAPNSNALKKDFYGNVEKLQGDADSQQFYRRKGYVQNTIFPKAFIELLSGTTTWKSINVKPTYGTTCDFIITNRYVSTFDKKVEEQYLRGNSIITAYNNLYNQYYISQKNLKSSLSRLTFCLQMNTVYGFDFFHYISQYLNQIHQLPSLDKKFSLKNLAGENLLSIISQVADLPLFYNKHVFLEYAFQELENSTDFSSAYYECSSSSAALILNLPPKTPAQETEGAFYLLRNFFQTLTNITIPVLLSLWKVIITKLLSEGCLSENDFAEYIKNNLLKDIALKKDSLPSKYLKDVRYTSDICFKDILPALNHSYRSEEITCAIASNLPRERKKDIEAILKHYYNFDNFKSQRFPSLFFSTASAQCSPFDKIIQPLQKCNLSLDSKDNRNLLDWLYELLHNLNNL